MSIRTINIDVLRDGVMPNTIQNGGQQYEHNATTIKFDIDADYLDELKALNSNLLFRIDFNSSAGGYDPSENLAENNLVRDIPYKFTCNGGNMTATLVVTATDEDGNATNTVVSRSTVIAFESVKRNAESQGKVENNLSAMEAKLREDLEAGKFKGEKGDPFTYDDFTPEQLEELKGEKGEDVDYSIVTNVLKGSATGNPIYINDISPFTHELVVSVNKGGATVQRSGKNFFDPSVLLKAIGWTKTVDGYYTGVSDNLSDAYHWNTGTIGSMYNGFKENTQYAFSLVGHNASGTGESVGFYFQYEDGTRSTSIKLSSVADAVIKFVSDPTKTVKGIHCSTYERISVYLKDIQLEESNINTPFMPYVEPTTYTADESGKVIGIKSLYPVTVLSANNEATISVKYNKDINVALSLGYVTPEMYNAVGDGITDDTRAIQAAFDSGKNIIFDNKTYLVDCGEDWKDGGIKPNSNQTIILGSATIKSKTNISGRYTVVNIQEKENVIIIGGKIEGDTDTHADEKAHLGYGLGIYESKNITVTGMEISKCQGDSIIVNTMDEKTGVCDHITIRDCTLHDNKRQGISVVCATNVIIDNCEIYNIKGAEPEAGIDIEGEILDNAANTNIAPNVSNVKISNCYIHDTDGASIMISSKKQKDIYIENCDLEAVSIGGGENVNISNCKINTLNAFSKYDLSVNNCKILSTPNRMNEYMGVEYLIDYAIQNSGTKTTYTNCYFHLHKDCTNIIKTSADSGKNLDRLVFNNCTFEADAARTMEGFLFNVPDKRLDYIEFNGCRANLGENIRFHQGLTQKGVVFNNCEFALAYISDKWSLLEIPSTVTDFSFVVRNTKIDAKNFVGLILCEMPEGSTMKLIITDSEVVSKRAFNSKSKVTGYVIIGNSAISNLVEENFGDMTKAIANNVPISIA